MKFNKLVIIPSVLALAVVASVVFTGNKVSAAAQCEVVGINTGTFGTRRYIGVDDKIFTVQNNIATGKVKVTGAAGCTTPVTLAVWKTTSKTGEPINSQTLFSYTTATFGPGMHTISAAVPACSYYQADILRGTSPTAPDGTANYGFQNGEWVKNGPYRDAAFGGALCETTPPVVTTSTPTPATPVSTTTLPATGPADLIAQATAITVAAAVAHNVFQRRRLAARG